ncbi:hypothetical protein CC86DRAFT_416310 [Ophiobolus disseminans]|uniref:Uncharacterized protein n=1 Tax=Ophiobolus disseminans TaxID=1469910 RepID=A0A6A7A0M5_9PLEO|nr:hypothetical protein CC86DRAFT_416310 [Ophiobolus disseminans]
MSYRSHSSRHPSAPPHSHHGTSRRPHELDVQPPDQHGGFDPSRSSRLNQGAPPPASQHGGSRRSNNQGGQQMDIQGRNESRPELLEGFSPSGRHGTGTNYRVRGNRGRPPRNQNSLQSQLQGTGQMQGSLRNQDAQQTGAPPGGHRRPPPLQMQGNVRTQGGSRRGELPMNEMQPSMGRQPRNQDARHTGAPRGGYGTPPLRNPGSRCSGSLDDYREHEGDRFPDPLARMPRNMRERPRYEVEFDRDGRGDIRRHRKGGKKGKGKRCGDILISFTYHHYAIQLNMPAKETYTERQLLVNAHKVLVSRFILSKAKYFVGLPFAYHAGNEGNIEMSYELLKTFEVGNAELQAMVDNGDADAAAIHKRSSELMGWLQVAGTDTLDKKQWEKDMQTWTLRQWREGDAEMAERITRVMGDFGMFE